MFGFQKIPGFISITSSIPHDPFRVYIYTKRVRGYLDFKKILIIQLNHQNPYWLLGQLYTRSERVLGFRINPDISTKSSKPLAPWYAIYIHNRKRVRGCWFQKIPGFFFPLNNLYPLTLFLYIYTREGSGGILGFDIIDFCIKLWKPPDPLAPIYIQPRGQGVLGLKSGYFKQIVKTPWPLGAYIYTAKGSGGFGFKNQDIFKSIFKGISAIPTQLLWLLLFFCFW